MSVLYRVRVKIAIPTFKTQFVEGLYIAREEVKDVKAVKSEITIRVMKHLPHLLPNSIVEVVLFRRSNIDFVFSETSEDLEDSK